MIDLPRKLPVFLAGCWLALGSSVEADEPGARPIVAGFERFHAEAGGDDAAGGRLLLGELNCVACHRGAEAPLSPVAAKRAPILDEVGSRVQLDHLRAYLLDPHKLKPGTTMPDLMAGRPRAEAEADVDALVHFLATTGTTTPKPPNRKLINAGKTLFEQSGCVACHGIPGETSAGLATSVPLGDLTGKYTYQSLTAFNADPLASRPSGRMPSLNLKEIEAQSISSYLLKEVRVVAPPVLAFRYYEGEWNTLPDLDALAPMATGLAEGFDLEQAQRQSNYAFRFEGTLEVDRPGPYTFHVASDDGSRISVDGKVVADNDGIHPNQSKAGRVRLTQGRHQVVVLYFQGSGEAELDVEYEGPGTSRRSLASALIPPEGSKPATIAPRFVPDPAKVEKGRALFASIGCASCHQLKQDGRAIEARAGSKALADLKGDSGCLASEPPPGVPDFDLAPRQRAALAAALKAPADKADDKRAIARTMVAFNCYACHARDGVGGVEEGRDSAFATTQKEMGDEGRIPPLLTGVGGKLTSAWLKHVLADGAKDRPYMKTRMPKFGEANVGGLAAPLEVVDSLGPVPVPHFDVPEKRVKAAGRFLVGSQAFNCGSCHQFKEYQAAGIQALDMTLMPRRLRRDWFERYVVDPPAFRPGTRMPTAWPGGKSTLDTVYDGDTAKQVESIWRYLSDGPDAAIPYGIGREPIPLVADKEAILYRNFIQGAGPRAIGVGYSEKANLAFDANDLRLALIWQGAFIDASKHWIGRGEGFQGPLGDNVLALPTGPSFAPLASPSAEWPRGKAKDLGQRFKGYRLVAGGKPAFLYDLGPVHVEDYPEAVSGGEAPTLRRTIELSANQGPGDLYYRAAVGKAIQPLGDGWFQVDGEWKVRVSAESAPVVRDSAGRSELIVPVKFDGGKARIVEEYAW